MSRFALSLLIAAGLVLMATAAACTKEPPPLAPTSEQELDEALRTIIVEQELTGDPTVGRDIPDIDDPMTQLGMQLFYSKALGGEQTVACVTCHHPLLGGGDNLRLSIGVHAVDPNVLGPGRQHQSGLANVPRNAPTTFNIALWDQVLFHDGRVESLGKTASRHGADGQGIRTPDEAYGLADPRAGDTLAMAQSRFPVTSAEEMRGSEFEAHAGNQAVRVHLAARIGDYGPGQGELAANTWHEAFAAVFGHDGEPETVCTEEHIFQAIAAYERSQVFVDNPWKAYVQGDDTAISKAAKRGAWLFFTSVDKGGAGCARCHSGDTFTDEQFYVLALPQIGPGKGDGKTGDDDFGRFRATGSPDDLYAFRTPSLLNVGVTGPFGHDGSYLNLEGIVRHHLNPAKALADYDFSSLEREILVANAEVNSAHALAKLEADRAAGRPAIEDVDLSDQQVDDILAFLLTLTDPCVKSPACLAPWIPSDSMDNPDGLRIHYNPATR